MPRYLYVPLRVVLALVAVVVVVRLVGWLVLWLRPDPAARATLRLVGRPALDDVADAAALLEPIRAKHKVPGLAGAVLKGGRVVALGATGVRKAGGEERITVEDRFHIGSDTKAMTATLIGVLVEEGRMAWTTTVGDVFGEVGGMDPAWKGVVVEHLLTHRAGAPANLDAGGLWGRLWEREGTPTQQRMQLVEGVLARPPEAAPGARYIYSNAGYAIAGAMAEKITGRAWEDLMRERVFAPLGITSAGFGAPGEPGKVDQPWGHTGGNRPVEPGPNADNPPAIGPAGTVHLTLADWVKFVAAHVAGARGKDGLFKAGTFARLHTPGAGPGEQYAMGWLVTERPWAKGDGPGDHGRVLTHAGSNTMWYAVAWLAPERDGAVLVVSNQGGGMGQKATDAAAGALIQRYLPESGGR